MLDVLIIEDYRVAEVRFQNAEKAIAGWERNYGVPLAQIFMEVRDGDPVYTALRNAVLATTHGLLQEHAYAEQELERLKGELGILREDLGTVDAKLDEVK